MKNKGVTLLEIMIALSILAVSFIPIMSLFGSNLKVTEKDQSNIIAMNLCREKLDIALKLSYSKFDVYANDQEARTNTTLSEGNVTLDLMDYVNNGITYQFHLLVVNRPITFKRNARIYDNSTNTDAAISPENYKFKEVSTTYNNLIRRYTMTVTWHDKGSPNKKHNYTLVTFKAKLQND